MHPEPKARLADLLADSKALRHSASLFSLLVFPERREHVWIVQKNAYGSGEFIPDRSCSFSSSSSCTNLPMKARDFSISDRGRVRQILCVSVEGDPK